MPTAPPPQWDTTGYEPDLAEEFAGDDLDPARWLPYHLPHWSSREQAAARYSVADGRLELRIDADQEPWCPELDGSTRVSSLQTALVAGPVGSAVGQHRFSPDAVVREAQPEARLYTPHFGLVEMTASARIDDRAMVALWMIGLEDVPERSGEICVAEIFGRDLRRGSAAVGMGVHPFGDPTLVDDFAAVRVPIDVARPHRYGVRWEPGRVAFYVDRRLVRVVDQAPDYPMQLMLGIYDFAGGEGSGPAVSPTAGYPQRFVVERVLGHRPVRGRP